MADAPAPELCAKYQALYGKATFVIETTKNKRKAAATEIFQFYANLLSSDAKYVWNKIVKEQTEADPFKYLQGISRKDPRLLSRESFDDCVMFHLLTVFSNNTAEQEKYFLSNVLKKPQRLVYVSLYSAYSSSMPMLHSYPAGTTAQATRPA